MNTEIKAKWIAALTSDTYQQGQGQLRKTEGANGAPLDEPRYCCLGVLCEIHRQETKQGRWMNANYAVESTSGDSYRYDVPPSAVVEWAGLTEANPNVEGGCVASMNDNGKTFKQIAQMIEEGL